MRRKVINIEPAPKKVQKRKPKTYFNDPLSEKQKENNKCKESFLQAGDDAIPVKIGMPSNEAPLPVQCKCGWIGDIDEMLCRPCSDILWCPECRKSQWDFK